MNQVLEPRCNENLEKKGGGRGRRVQCGNPAITGREIKEFKTNGTKKSLRLKTNKQINKQINKNERKRKLTFLNFSTFS